MGLSTAHRVALPALLLAGALLSACAALAPTIDVEPASPSALRTLSIELHEISPAGALIHVNLARRAPAAATRLQVRRAPASEEPSLWRELALPAGAHAPSTLELRDPTLRPGQTVRYLAVLVDRRGTPLHQVVQREVNALPLPSPPSQVRGRVVLANRVELSWEARPELGALIYRRDVLSPDGPARLIARVAPHTGARFIDHDTEPEGVWAYRVALTDDRQGIPRRGPASEPTYVHIAASSK